MNKNLLIIAVSAMVLSACGSASWPAASRRGTSTPTPAENPAETQLEYTNQDFGFSLHYPKGYEMQRTFAHQFTFSASSAPQATPDERGVAYLEVERNLDQDAGWYANRMIQEVPVWASNTLPQYASSMASRRISSSAWLSRT